MTTPRYDGPALTGTRRVPYRTAHAAALTVIEHVPASDVLSVLVTLGLVDPLRGTS